MTLSKMTTLYIIDVLVFLSAEELYDKLKTEFSDLQYLILHFSTFSDKKCM